MRGDSTGFYREYLPVSGCHRNAVDDLASDRRRPDRVDGRGAARGARLPPRCGASSFPSRTRRQTSACSSGIRMQTAAGGVLVHVENRPANAAHVLHLDPGDIANADVESSALDINGSGNPCPREGTLVVTPPGDSVSHELPVALPICHATISSVAQVLLLHRVDRSAPFSGAATPRVAVVVRRPPVARVRAVAVR